MNAARSRSRHRTVTALQASTDDESRVGVAPLSKDDTRTADEQHDKRSDQSENDDEFDYAMEFDKEYGWMLKVESGCPECGNDAIFNGSYEVSPQFVGYKEAEDGDAMLLGQDDVVHIQVNYLWCGECEEVVVDNRHQRVDDQRER